MPTRERAQVIRHGGKQIVLLDFSGLNDEAEALAEIEKARQFVARHPADKSLLTLTDGSSGLTTKPVIDALKELAAHNAPYVRAGAAVSNSGLHRVIITAVAVFTKRRLPIFATRAEALEWLVKQ